MWIEYKLIDSNSTSKTAITHIINCDNIWSFEVSGTDFIIRFSDRVGLKYFFQDEDEVRMVKQAFTCSLSGFDLNLGTLGFVRGIRNALK